MELLPSTPSVLWMMTVSDLWRMHINACTHTHRHAHPHVTYIPITDNDLYIILDFSFLSEILIQFEEQSYAVNEGDGNVNIKLVLVDGTILRPFDVSIEFMNGTALGR